MHFRVIAPGLLLAMAVGCGGKALPSEPEGGEAMLSADAAIASEQFDAVAVTEGSGDEGASKAASPDAADETLGSVVDGGSEGSASPGFLSCVPTTRYADDEPCPAGGGPFVRYECGGSCLEFVTLLGPVRVQCLLGGSMDGGNVPLTDAGTIVACCPPITGGWADPVPCEGPFM
jgi:hypothetical protein